MFDALDPARHEQAEAERARMKSFIARVAAAETPFWTDPMSIILDTGEFRRGMWLLPSAEAQEYWAELEPHLIRLYAIWDDEHPPPEG